MNSNDIEARLQLLERRVNRYRTTAILLGIAVIGLLGTAATDLKGVSEEVRTRKLVVVDAQGKDAIDFVSTDQGCTFRMHNRKGYIGAAIATGEKGGELILADKDGERCVQLRAEDAGGQVEVQNKAGQKHILTPLGPGK